MKIEEKFEKLIMATKRNLTSETLELKMLELQLLEPDELVQTGFVDKAVDYVLDAVMDGILLTEDIDEYFDEKCAGIPMNEFYRTNRPLSISGTASGYIYSLKYDMIRCHLLERYMEFLRDMKSKNRNEGFSL